MGWVLQVVLEIDAFDGVLSIVVVPLLKELVAGELEQELLYVLIGLHQFRQPLY